MWAGPSKPNGLLDGFHAPPHPYFVRIDAFVRT